MTDTFFLILKNIDQFYRMSIFPLMILVGCCGQLISIKIFLTVKDWNSTCKAYYLTMAIADLVYLLALGIPTVTDRVVYFWTGENSLRFQPHNISHLTCKLLAYSIHVSGFLSYWSLLVYAIERLIAIWNPFMRVQYIHIKNAKKVCFVVSLFALLLFSPILFANPYKLLKEESSIYYRDCNLNVQNESILVKVWYVVAVVILSISGGSLGLLLVNAALLYKLRICMKSRNLMNEGLKNFSGTPEIKAAKDIIVRSSVTLAFMLPLLCWAGFAITRSMLFTVRVFNTQVCFNQS